MTFSQLLGAGGIYGIILLLKPVCSLLTSRQRALDDYATIDTSALISSAYTGIVALAAWYGWSHFNREQKKILFQTPLKWFFIYGVVCFFSTLWSVNSTLTFYRSVECMAFFILSIVIIANILEKYDIETLIKWLLLFGIFNLLMRLILLRSILFYSNVFCSAGQMFVPIYFYLALLESRSIFVKSVFSFFSFFSLSTVAYIGMTLGGFCIAIQRKYRFLLVVIVIFSAFFGVKPLLKKTIFFDKANVSFSETSGRNNVVAVAWDAIQKKPIQGYGFVSAEPYIFFNGDGVAAIAAHNAFVSALLGCGIMGGVSLTLFFLMSFIYLWKYATSRYFSSLLGTFCIIFIEAIGNPGIGSRVYAGWIDEVLVLSALIAICHQMKETSAVDSSSDSGITLPQ